MAKVATLTYYPVKGLGGISVGEAEVLEAGLGHDREFMLVDPQDGTFHSQRTLPRMAAVRVAHDGNWLRFRADGAEELAIEVTHDGPRRDVSLFGKWFGSGIEQDGRAAKWFTEVLAQPATLVRVAPDHDRPGWGVHQGKAAVLWPGRIAVGDEVRVDSWLPAGDDPGAIAHHRRPSLRNG